MRRIYVEKLNTGAIWSSVMPQYGIWKKEFMGGGFSSVSIPAGSVVSNFYPFSKKNKKRFRQI